MPGIIPIRTFVKIRAIHRATHIQKCPCLGRALRKFLKLNGFHRKMRKMRNEDTAVSTKVLVVLRLSTAFWERVRWPSHRSTRLSACKIQMTLEMKNNIVKKTLMIVRIMTQMTAAASRWLFSMTFFPDIHIMRFRERLSERSHFQYWSNVKKWKL